MRGRLGHAIAAVAVAAVATLGVLGDARGDGDGRPTPSNCVNHCLDLVAPYTRSCAASPRCKQTCAQGDAETCKACVTECIEPHAKSARACLARCGEREPAASLG